MAVVDVHKIDCEQIGHKQTGYNGREIWRKEFILHCSSQGRDINSRVGLCWRERFIQRRTRALSMKWPGAWAGQRAEVQLKLNSGSAWSACTWSTFSRLLKETWSKKEKWVLFSFSLHSLTQFQPQTSFLLRDTPLSPLALSGERQSSHLRRQMAERSECLLLRASQQPLSNWTHFLLTVPALHSHHATSSQVGWNGGQHLLAFATIVSYNPHLRPCVHSRAGHLHCHKIVRNAETWHGYWKDLLSSRDDV